MATRLACARPELWRYAHESYGQRANGQSLLPANQQASYALPCPAHLKGAEAVHRAALDDVKLGRVVQRGALPQDVLSSLRRGTPGGGSCQKVTRSRHGSGEGGGERCRQGKEEGCTHRAGQIRQRSTLPHDGPAWLQGSGGVSDVAKAAWHSHATDKSPSTPERTLAAALICL